MKIFEWTCAELAEEMKRRYGKGMYHAAAVYRQVFKKGTPSSNAFVQELGNSMSLATKIAEDIRFPACRIVFRQEEGEISKLAVALPDGHLVESVLIFSNGRTTQCVSSQVGCRMGCKFCVTGEMGFVRDLTVEEIVWQVYAARFELGRSIDNVVFMGMGEPLDNFDNVVQAVRVMQDQRGLDIACSHITLSTAGHAEGIQRLASLGLENLRLAVSLNAAEDALRSDLMPINRRYPLNELKEVLRSFPLGKNGTILIEYVLISGVNDAGEDVESLSRYLEGLCVRVNVIACNPGSAASYKAPSPESLKRFCQLLAKKKIFVRSRQPKGQGVMAACGQLGFSLRRKQTGPHQKGPEKDCFIF